MSENSSLERVEADLKEVVKDSQGPVDVTGRRRKDGQCPVGCGDSSRDEGKLGKGEHEGIE